MNLIRNCAAIALFCVAASAALADPPASKEEARLIAATAILDEWQQMPDLAIPDRLLQRAQAIAVFPGNLKGAFFVGARGGGGVVLVRDAAGNWSAPSFATLGGGSFGFQWGFESSDIILVFTTRRGIEGMSGGKVTIGFDISGAVGPVGRQMSGSTDAGFNAEVYSYSRTKGLFAGVALDGSSMSIDHSANASYYGQPDLLASDIFAGKITNPPAGAQGLMHAVTRLVGGTRAPAGAPAAAPGTTPAGAPAANAPRTDDKGLESGGAATFPLDPPH